MKILKYCDFAEFHWSYWRLPTKQHSFILLVFQSSGLSNEFTCSRHTHFPLFQFRFISAIFKLIRRWFSSEMRWKCAMWADTFWVDNRLPKQIGHLYTLWIKSTSSLPSPFESSSALSWTSKFSLCLSSFLGQTWAWNSCSLENSVLRQVAQSQSKSSSGWTRE